MVNVNVKLRSFGHRSIKRFRQGGATGLARFFHSEFKKGSYKWAIHPVLVSAYGNRIISGGQLRRKLAMEGSVVDCNITGGISIENIPSDGPLQPNENGDELYLHLTDAHGDPYSPAPPYNTNVDPRVCECHDATIVGPVPFGVTRDGQLILDTIFHTRKNSRRLRVSLYRYLDERSLLEIPKPFSSAQSDFSAEYDQATLLTSLWGDNFGHWMSEDLLKIRYLENYADRTGEFPTLIVKQDPPGWKVEYLEELGYGDQYVEWDGGPASVNTLVVPPFPHPTPGMLNWLRTRIPQDASLAGSTKERIYISRQRDRKNRRVSNFDELEPVLSEYGFDSYALEEMSVVEQATLFKNAEVIFGVHGAGFSNALYSEDPTLIEILDGRVHPAASWTYVSAMLGWDHQYIRCQTDASGIEIDPSEARKVLDGVVG